MSSDSKDFLAHSFVSVIIPVFNDGERLKKCLFMLERQTYPKEFYEVIVVNNASNENISAIVNQFEKATYQFESRPGSYAARNKGFSASKGEIIAFTDADCVPKENWIEEGVRALHSLENIGLVGGKINLTFKDPKTPTSAELYDQIVVGLPQKQFIEESNYGATANVFTFRKVIEKVGAFDPTLKSNGDYEWGQRVFLAGYHQIYSENVCVDHPARDSISNLVKKARRITGGKVDSQQKNSYPAKDFLKDFLRDILPPFRFIFSMLSLEHVSLNNKIKIIIIRFLLKNVSAWERLRVQLGGDSCRE